MTHRFALATFIIAAALVTSAVVGAQQGRGGGAPAAAPRNLQVLPEGTTTQQVVQVMQTFTQALGVTCAHCHVFVANGSPMNDMASDMKPQKNIARAMMRMAADINTRLETVVSKSADQRTRVQCVTCHRGSAIPSAQPFPAGGRATTAAQN